MTGTALWPSLPATWLRLVTPPLIAAPGISGPAPPAVSTGTARRD